MEEGAVPYTIFSFFPSPSSKTTEGQASCRNSWGQRQGEVSRRKVQEILGTRVNESSRIKNRDSFLHLFFHILFLLFRDVLLFFQPFSLSLSRSLVSFLESWSLYFSPASSSSLLSPAFTPHFLLFMPLSARLVRSRVAFYVHRAKAAAAWYSSRLFFIPLIYVLMLERTTCGYLSPLFDLGLQNGFPLCAMKLLQVRYISGVRNLWKYEMRRNVDDVIDRISARAFYLIPKFCDLVDFIGFRR